MLREDVGVTERGLLLGAVFIGDGVDGVDAWDVDYAVLDDLAVLDVDAANFREVAVGGSVGRDELSDNGELPAGVDGLAFTEEGLVTHTEGVEVASVFVADTTVTIVAVTTLSAGASGLTVGAANVRGVCGSVGVGLPDIHLVTTGAVLARARVRVVLGRLPVEDIGLVEEGWSMSEFTDMRPQLTSPLMNLISWGHWVSQ